ncbi:MAG: NAD(P)/FAD-dependent oxidoreductase [Bacteroidetes bacterium]|nr:MAG: NAD(P)/FAD-dependent oxidoreductase [Bacteroidota bacterium]
MNRRDFIWQASSLALLPLVACRTEGEKTHFPITVHSDMTIGHTILQHPPQKTDKILTTDCLIVGGGIAGLSAGVALAGKDREFLVCELSDRWGGTSGALAYDNTHIAQGAHYELQYPQHFDEKLLHFWENLGVISYNKTTAHWEFEDEKYIIAGDKEGKTWNGKAFRDDVLPNNAEAQAFLAYIEENFLGKIKLPTRIMAQELHYLNEVTFLAYLQKQFPRISPELLRAIDYQMLDDYGGTSAQVSALAGVYYYGARPYTADENVAFSPPQGNYYFIEKLLAEIPKEALRLGRMVYKILPAKDHILVETLNTATHTIETIKAKKLIYAGQKHALKHIFPQDYKLFQHTERAPWLVVNVILKKPLEKPVFWQNEVVKDNLAFLGFVNSLAQGESRQVLTAYFCFKPEDRPKLATYWANYTLQEIADFFRMAQKDLATQVESVFMQVMGHAMAIPTPKFLWNDANAHRHDSRIVYAGADNARLPLMLEACDSGLEATHLIL